MRVAVFGAQGRMGQEVCRAVTAAPDLELVAELDQDGPRQGALDARAEIVVDFTHPDAVLGNLEWSIGHGLDVVVGTSGFTPARLDTVRGWLDGKPEVGILVAPNFSIGAVLMMRFAQLAAPHFDSAEVIEFHHTQKVDAPSGTARQTAALIAAARAAAGLGPVPDPTTHELAGSRGGVVDGIHVHALRLAGLLASQEVHFASPGETLVLRDDSRDRTSFMPGVLAALRWLPGHPGLTVGIEELLGVA